jgi:hypothetical protein
MLALPRRELWVEGPAVAEAHGIIESAKAALRVLAAVLLSVLLAAPAASVPVIRLAVCPVPSALCRVVIDDF